MNNSITFAARRRKSSSAPTIQTVKGRVVFFRAQREKISTLKPLTVRIFAAAFSPPKTGNRIFTTLHPAFVRFILAAKPSALARRSLSAFAGLRAPRPRPQTRNRMECQYVTQRQSPLCNSVKCKKRSRSDKYLKQPAGTRWARNSSPGRFLLGKFKAKAAENERKTATVQK